MWCLGGGKSYSCELNEMAASAGNDKHRGKLFMENENGKLLENLFSDPPKAVENFVDYCKSALYKSHFGKLFRMLRDSLAGSSSFSSLSSLSSSFPQPPRRRKRRRRRLTVDDDDEQHDKHVMFADSLGLDLELIHTIQINTAASNAGADDLDKLITKQSFFNSYNNNNNSNHTMIAQQSSNTTDKLIIPKFALSPDRNYEKLIKNGICLNSIEIYNQSSIRGVVLTLTKPPNRVALESTTTSCSKLNEEG